MPLGGAKLVSFSNMRRSGAIMAVVLATACGRLGFDALVDGSETDGSNGDGPPAVSCGTLAATCGPMGNRPCCESPVVTGGTFFRSYDMADATYTDMTNPATVSTFRLDKYEVTVARFRTFVDASMGTQVNPPPAGAGARTLSGMANQGGWDPSWNASLAINTGTLVANIKCEATYQTWTDSPGGNESRPMNCITWYEAMAFCVWDGGYLPTEAEWNYAAAGGGDQRALPWSSPAFSLTNDDSTYASYYVDATKQCFGDGINGCALTDLVPVGSKPAGDGMFGQSDLGGNAWEWVLDWHASPYANPCNDCARLTPASNRVFRGGSFGTDATFLRAADRGDDTPTSRSGSVGVRCSRTP